MTPIQYVINPPKMAGNSQVYYKDIIVYSIQDNKVLGAKMFDYNFIAKPVSTLDITYDPRLSTFFGNIKQIDTATLTNTITRTNWVFNDEYEAFIQKIICLKKLREVYNINEKEDKQIFNTKIPSNINTVFDKIKIDHPEYFL